MALIDNIDKYISEAVAHYWRTRRLQRERQKKRGVNDAGLRSAVTGGAQMDGFIDLLREPHFKVFPEFVGASYMKRYEIFCRKLVLERHYTASSFIVSDSSQGENGVYREPAPDLSFENFAKTISSHVRSFA